MVVCVPGSASASTRWTDEIAEGTEAQSLERVNESPSFTIRADKSANVDNKATMPVFVWYVFREDVHEDMLCALLLPTNTPAAELLKSLNDCTSGPWIGHFVSVYAWMERLPWLDSLLVSLLGSKRSLLNVSLCTVPSIGKCWKMSPEPNGVLQDVIKIISLV